jgi:hypothetical protein
MTTVEKQEDVLGGLFEALIGDGFTGYCCGPKDDPHAVIAVYEWPGRLDVIAMPRKGPAAAARLAKPAVRVPAGEPNPLVLNPPTTALWAWVGPMDMVVWALLDLPHPECPNAPAAEIPTPAALSVPREQQRPMYIRVPDEEKASTRAARLSQPRPPKIMSKQFFNDLVDEVDSQSAIGFALNFTEDGKLTFGNFNTQVGRTAITKFTNDFFSWIRSVKHQVDDYWRLGEQLAMTSGSVTFASLNGGTVTMPYASVSHFTPDGTLLTHHRTYLDPSPVVGVTVPD